MKKGQILEGIIERVDFPNKGVVQVEGEEKKVIVKNGAPGQKIRFSIIFDSVVNRKARHDMERKFTDKVIEYED